MQENLPTINIFKIDYSFIIKNYLNPELWKKKWTLFIYKSFIFSLKIYSIDCANEKITFEVTLEDTLNHDSYDAEWNSYPYKISHYISYSLKIENSEFLKNKINSAMKILITGLEINRIKATEEYKSIKNTKETEKDTLREIAEQFLDDNHVSNEDIREVYIDNYIDNNAKIDGKLDEFVDRGQYLYLTELYLILADTLDNDTLKYYVETAFINNKEELENIKSDVESYSEIIETEAFENEMKINLEDL